MAVRYEKKLGRLRGPFFRGKEAHRQEETKAALLKRWKKGKEDEPFGLSPKSMRGGAVCLE